MENLGNLIVGAVVVLVVLLAVWKLIKDKRENKWRKLLGRLFGMSSRYTAHAAFVTGKISGKQEDTEPSSCFLLFHIRLTIAISREPGMIVWETKLFLPT